MIRRAIEESQKFEQAKKQELDQEEEMIRQAIELSKLEEEVRQKKIEVQEVEQQKQLRAAELASIKVEKVAQVDTIEQTKAVKQLTKVKMTEEQLRQQALEQQKLEDIKRMKSQQATEKSAFISAEPMPALPQLQPRSGGLGLPSIGGRQGNFEIDADYLKKAQLELNKLDAINDFDEEESKTKVEDNRSMQEILRQKRLQTEQALEEQKKNQATNAQETLEERQARLKANRDLLKMHKKKEREDELNEFNSKIRNQGDLYEELKNLDAKKKLPTEQEELERRR